jgi:hypothetical protein
VSRSVLCQTRQLQVNLQAVAGELPDSCTGVTHNNYLVTPITTCKLIVTATPCQDSGTVRQPTEPTLLLAHRYPRWAVTRELYKGSLTPVLP